MGEHGRVPPAGGGVLQRHAAPREQWKPTGSNFGGARAATFDFYSTGVALSQVLFDFGQNLSLIHAAQRSAESTAADAATQHDTVVLNVEEAYFGLLASYRLRDVADETVRRRCSSRARS